MNLSVAISCLAFFSPVALLLADADSDEQVIKVQRALHASRSKHYRRHHIHDLSRHPPKTKNMSRKVEAIGEEEPARNIFARAGAADSHLYVNAQTGNDSNNGSTASLAVQTLSKALILVENASRPLSGDLIVHLAGSFEGEQLVLDNSHAGTSSTQRVVFQGAENGSPTRLLGGNALNFVKVSTLASSDPVYQLAQLAGVSLDNLYAAAPPSDFPSNDSDLKWPDGDCRDLETYGKFFKL